MTLLTSSSKFWCSVVKVIYFTIKLKNNPNKGQQHIQYLHLFTILYNAWVHNFGGENVFLN